MCGIIFFGLTWAVLPAVLLADGAAVLTTLSSQYIRSRKFFMNHLDEIRNAPPEEKMSGFGQRDSGAELDMRKSNELKDEQLERYPEKQTITPRISLHEFDQPEDFFPLWEEELVTGSEEEHVKEETEDDSETLPVETSPRVKRQPPTAVVPSTTTEEASTTTTRSPAPPDEAVVETRPDLLHPAFIYYVLAVTVPCVIGWIIVTFACLWICRPHSPLYREILKRLIEHSQMKQKSVLFAATVLTGERKMPEEKTESPSK